MLKYNINIRYYTFESNIYSIIYFRETYCVFTKKELIEIPLIKLYYMKIMCQYFFKKLFETTTFESKSLWSHLIPLIV